MEFNSDLNAPLSQGVKSKAGLIIGFILGATGFLILFKIIILDRTSPEDELAPGAVLMAAVINGVLFALIGRAIQRYLQREASEKAK